MKYILLTVVSLLIAGCGGTQFKTVWSTAGEAAYNGVTDPLTPGLAFTSALLYASGYDADITHYLMEHPLVKTEDDELYRDINRYEALTTALVINDDNYTTKAKRFFLQYAILEVAKKRATLLENNITKASPDGSHYGSIGSHHSLDHFTASAINRRNVDRLEIPKWGKYSLNTLSYAAATASALTRVQDGGHYFADQVLTASIGNFTGIFFHDLFRLNAATDLQVGFSKGGGKIGLSFTY